jgi:hypothetical protein
MEEKVMRQLRRAMQPALTDITVTWKGAQVQPAPYRFAPLFCGGRLVVYGIVDKKAESDLGEVEVTVSAKTAVKPFEASLKVDLAKPAPGSLFHKLAAKTLLKYPHIFMLAFLEFFGLTSHSAGTWRRAAVICTTPTGA